MSKRRSYPKSMAEAKAAGDAPAPGRAQAAPRRAWSLALRAAWAAACLACAVVICRATVDQLRAESYWYRATNVRSSGTQTREVELRRAMALHPHNPLIKYDLAQMIVENENKKYRAGQTRALFPDKLDEAAAMLAEIEVAYPSRPMLVRLRGEAQLMLADIERRAGRPDASAGRARAAAEDLEFAYSVLPVPRASPDNFYGNIMQAAVAAKRHDIAAAVVHRLLRDRRTTALELPVVQSSRRQSWFLLGVFTEIADDLPRLARTGQDNDLLFQQLRFGAERQGLEPFVYHLLLELNDRGELTDPALIRLLVDLHSQRLAAAGATTAQGEE